MKIGGFQLPKLNLGNLIGGIGGQVLNGIKDTLKSVVGDFFKSGFEGAKKSLLDTIAKQLGLPAPSSANIGAPGAPNGNTGIVGSGGITGGAATGGTAAAGGAGNTTAGSPVGMANQGGQFNPSNARSMIAENMGAEAASMFDGLPPAQQKEMAMQAAMQKTARISQLMTNMLQTLHEMSKSIIQNTRG
ncbi:hypothetical protein JRI60_16010 [Archangium violaceum]|uniref:hypothetical protein n=1 Tax=Archangium violaceum TaxID=83451 RepID=UPI00194E3C91|nr:hypothetical protein [Archangium violaceum]QRO00419.1 hypothetical protein JRI60_15995 [Archangium violaceum]QRO00420.1 hypothetical protein JRI60_16000 [Archangium violaceum]QRO00421.1 hypothetical protein JRI60_16005 [Archangium violaceum]QRO00422.1 hypothetical protein JRI60_16010 [Archangium violaceum]